MKITNSIGTYKLFNREWYQRDTSEIKFITVHHTAGRETGTDDQILTALMRGHINQGWPGLAYHFVILKNGNIYQINNFEDVTWHDTVNWDSIGICLPGYFHSPYNEKPTGEQLKSLRWLLDQLSTQHPEFPADQSKVLGHRERSSTACPGDNLIGYVQDYRNKLGKVDWGNYETPPPDIYIQKNKDLKIAIDRMKSEHDTAMADQNVNQKNLYDSSTAKAKRIGETGTL